MTELFYETERLYLRPFNESDADDLFEMERIPEVHIFLGRNPLTQLSQAKRVIKKIQTQYEKNGIGRWVVLDRKTHEFLGWSGLKIETMVRPGSNYFDLGYRFHPKAWGKGLATESALFWIEYAFKILNVTELNAATEFDNIASIKVLEKLGFHQTETFDFEGKLCRFFSLKNK